MISPATGTAESPKSAAGNSVADALRAAKNSRELADAWFIRCDMIDGPDREALQAIYSEKLRSFGALHP